METKKKTINVGDIVRIKWESTAGAEFGGRYGLVTGKTRIVYGPDRVLNRIKLELFGDAEVAYIELNEDMVEYECGTFSDEPSWFEESKKSKPTPKRTIAIEITDDGADAKYVCGKEVRKTASIKRHPDDKPDDETAAVLVTEKLFGRNLRDLESAIDEDFRLHSETLGWIQGAKEALEEAEKRIRKLI